jgi:hypothetical protein
MQRGTIEKPPFGDLAVFAAMGDTFEGKVRHHPSAKPSHMESIEGVEHGSAVRLTLALTHVEL